VKKQPSSKHGSYDIFATTFVVESNNER